ncbi:EF-hand [Neocallimastix lanati (nom. inval.)]|jgi:Ca2+-binding EF-hand superfamily protein|uniref:EF-hand n=1 Tax=Neocallimastix californiae TaxID=1754190 RepID=A0A1Y2AUC0_9FUNG|nr:EF-hand [Neocallimastix sp. JGI-2020a]ORY25880.1 EF-hand [Neocallimastix californiae]|eukprot:ORY25880.1 EF-hand [Neocallimastix californiae]
MYQQNALFSKRMFDSYDSDGSGGISISEFRSLAYDLGHYLTDEELDIAIKTLDSKGNGNISYKDFKAWWSNPNRWAKLQLTDENVKVLSTISKEFQKFDKDKSGSIERSEFKKFYKAIHRNHNISTADEKTMFEQLDSNGDNQVSFNEFIEYLTGKYCGDLSKYLD